MGLRASYTVSLVFAVIGVLIGLLLRYHFVSPLPFNLKYLLHAHSHVMLLGWIFNAFFTWIAHFLDGEIVKKDRWLFLLLHIAVLGMLLSFPFQGYGAVSIAFSTLHIVMGYILGARFLKRFGRSSQQTVLTKTAIWFYFISTLGPFALAPIMVLGYGHTPLYDQAIYFYLHFLINGFLMTLTLGWLQFQCNIVVRVGHVVLFGAGTILNFSQSLDYSFDSYWLVVFGFLSTLLQLPLVLDIVKRSRGSKKWLRWMALLILAKYGFQLPGSVPAFSGFVAGNRFWLMAYLHFMFLGIVTPVLWQIIARAKFSDKSLKVYFALFALTELALLLPYFNNRFIGMESGLVQLLVFCAYLLLAVKMVRIHLVLMAFKTGNNRFSMG